LRTFFNRAEIKAREDNPCRYICQRERNSKGSAVGRFASMAPFPFQIRFDEIAGGPLHYPERCVLTRESSGTNPINQTGAGNACGQKRFGWRGAKITAFAR
jgi:hypothetical protein